MRIIRIVSDGVVTEIEDDGKESLEEATQNATQLMKSEKIVILIGKNSSIVVRPSTISSVSVFDNQHYKFKTTSEGMEILDESPQNQEQKIERVDEITDSIDEGDE